MAVSHNKRSLGPNTLLYPEPALLVCVWDAAGKANVMTAAWGGICCSEPPLLAVSIRPERWTYGALLSKKAFTVGIPSESMLAGADFAGMVSGRRMDKFSKAGFSALKAEFVDAPYVAECPVVLECSLSNSLELGSHTLMIGAILDVKADPGCLDASGEFPDIAKVAPLIYDAGSRAYYGVGRKLGEAFSVGKNFFGPERD
ncbi:MAG: flavin reductase family protein [Desulfovibrio sp.]|jgi:flavin reductase (DIM6/NTAB) family NADH-FMN oxidoreductase RutF|nr:flavin reductase family protein [Desulfovibrio sp.]